MSMGERLTFPQASNLDNVIEVVRYLYYLPGASIEEIAEFLDYESDIALNYISAVQYLGLVDDKRVPTPRSKHIMCENGLYAAEGVYECIIEDKIIGKVFARALLQPEPDLNKYAQEIVSKYYHHLGASTLDDISYTIVQWCKKIIKYGKSLRTLRQKA